MTLESLSTKGVNGLIAARHLGAIDAGHDVLGQDHYDILLAQIQAREEKTEEQCPRN